MSAKTWRGIMFVYVITFLVTIPMSFLSKHKDLILHSSLNNFLNTYFVAGYGYTWFTVLTMMILWYSIATKGSNQNSVWIMRNYAITTVWVILMVSWFFGPCLFDRLDIVLGGHCVVNKVNLVVSKGQCAKKDGKWVSVFDASGHYLLILSMSLNIWQILTSDVFERETESFLDIESQQDLVQTPQTPQSSRTHPRILAISGTALKTLTVIIICIWYGEFVITSIFFHTTPEKFIGLVIGSTVPLVTHYL